MFYNSQVCTVDHDHPSREEVCTDHLSPTSGVVQDDTLVSEQGGHQVLIPVGTPAWHSWLETATTFTFKGHQGSFTAHKARASNRRGGWYWYAYRRQHGHLSNLYLGTSEKLTLPRLSQAARTLAERADRLCGESSGTMRRPHRWLRPTSFSARIHDISLDLLLRDGIRGIIVDLDNTLVGYKAAGPDQEVADWIGKALERGIKVAVVTNNATQWARNVAKELQVPCIHDARKPSPKGFLQALKVLDTPKDATVLVGDQLFTDVLGAKLFGMKVILTEPLVTREQWWMRALRFFERIMLYRMPRPEWGESRES